MKWEKFPGDKTAKWKNFSLKQISLKNMKKDQLLILLLSGILLMVVVVPTGKKEDTKKTADTGSQKTGGEITGMNEESYTAYLENRLSQILSKIEGAGEVDVMITLKSTSEKILNKDVESDQETVTEEDSQGGTRQSSNVSKKESTVYDGGSQETGTPYVSKEISPQIEGVIVIADGGGSAVVKENISSAVQALFDIEPHKIRIMKKAGG